MGAEGEGMVALSPYIEATYSVFAPPAERVYGVYFAEEESYDVQKQ